MVQQETGLSMDTSTFESVKTDQFMEPVAEEPRKELVQVQEEQVAMAYAGDDDALPPLESLTCQICKTYFSDPVTLPCMHSFCKSCLEKYNGRPLAGEVIEEDEEVEVEEDGENQGPQEDESEEEEEGANGSKKRKAKKKVVKPLYCPTCKDCLNLDNAFFSEPFPNDRLARIVKLLHETKILCQNCEASASEYRCTVCDAYTCQACWDVTHAAPIFRGHQPERLTHSEMTCPPKCESHILNDIEYFCTEDELGVCQVCLLKGEFKGKAYTLISDVRKQRQREIEEGVSEALLQRARLTEARKANEETLESLSENLSEQQAAVKQNFSEIRKALEEREHETLEALQALHDSKKNVLDSQIKAIDIQKRRIEDGVRNINLVLNHSNDLEVVYLTYVLQHQVANLTDVPSTSPFDGPGPEPNHDPAVDADLPVILSSKIPSLVKSYATVPEASLVEEIITGQTGPEALQGTSGSKEQQQILKSVAGSNVEPAEYGCLIQ